MVQFLYSGQEIIIEKTQDDTIRYIRGYGILSSDSEKARTYYHYVSDEANSVTHITDENSVLNKYEYDVFGNTTSCEEKVHNPFRYRGQQLDSITNQYYLRARYYNPVIGRFTQEDSYHGDGLNLYAYCDNNPVKYYDPSGYSKVDANDNKKALQSLVDEINERGGATADERSILEGWADEYGVPKDSMGLESQKQLPGPTSSSGVEPRAHVPSSEGGSKTPSEIAKSWQGSGKYPGIDNYKDITLKKGKIIYRGEPNGTEYFTTKSAIERSGRDATAIYEGLQVEKNPIHGYRGNMQGYMVNEDVAAAFGITKANPQFGKGGLPQIFVPDVQELINKGILVPVDNVPLVK